MDLKQLQSFSEDDQLDINLVRIFLQVNSLVEITECKGNRIRVSAFQGKRDVHKSKAQWPRQMEPAPRQVRLWQKYLTNTFISHFRYLKQPVGIPTTIVNSSSHYVVEETSCNTLEEALSLLPIFQHRIIEESTQVATDIEIWRAFRSKRRLKIITDGGLKEHNATFEWKIILPDFARSYFKVRDQQTAHRNQKARRAAVNFLAFPHPCSSHCPSTGQMVGTKTLMQVSMAS
jgi:hypothetical protein